MNNGDNNTGNYSFAKNFFNRPETDDTIGHFKKEYMESMKNYRLALDGNSRNGSPLRMKNRNSDMDSTYKNKNNYGMPGRFDENNIRSPPPSDLFSKPKNDIKNKQYDSRLRDQLGSSVSKVRMANREIPSSRISSTSTLSSENSEDISILMDEFKSLKNNLYRQQTQLQSLKNELNQEKSNKLNLQSRLDNLESVVMGPQMNRINLKPVRSVSAYDTFYGNNNNTYNRNRQAMDYDNRLRDQLRNKTSGDRHDDTFHYKRKNEYNDNHIQSQRYDSYPYGYSQRYNDNPNSNNIPDNQSFDDFNRVYRNNNIEDINKFNEENTTDLLNMRISR